MTYTNDITISKQDLEIREVVERIYKANPNLDYIRLSIMTQKYYYEKEEILNFRLLALIDYFSEVIIEKRQETDIITQEVYTEGFPRRKFWFY